MPACPNPACRAENGRYAAFCASCGAPLKAITHAPPSPHYAPPVSSRFWLAELLGRGFLALLRAIGALFGFLGGALRLVVVIALGVFGVLLSFIFPPAGWLCLLLCFAIVLATRRR